MAVVAVQVIVGIPPAGEVPFGFMVKALRLGDLLFQGLDALLEFLLLALP